MKRVYLIRHGLPDFPGGKRMCIGITDVPMGQAGREQAAEMAKRLPAVTAVFSSPLTRAIQTAEAVGQPVTILRDLWELDAGQWDGLTFDEIRLRYPALYAARGNDPTLPLPGAEDHGSGLARFAAAMELAAETAPGDCAVVAHGGVIGLFLEKISGKWRKPGYGEIISMIYNNGIFTLYGGE